MWQSFFRPRTHDRRSVPQCGVDQVFIKIPLPGRITVLGQAYGQLRYRDYALLTGYRQMVDDGYVNRQDNRMIPNTFEGVTLKGKVGIVAYNVGYLWDIKPRNSDEFISMSQQAGGTGPSEGLVLTSLTLTPWKHLNVYLGNDYVPNVFNTLFGKADYTHHLTEEWKLELDLQRGVGNAQIGDFSPGTWGSALACPGGGSPSARPRTSRATMPTSNRPTGAGPATCRSSRPISTTPARSRGASDSHTTSPERSSRSRFPACSRASPTRGARTS